MFMHYENMTQTMVNSKINPRNSLLFIFPIDVTYIS